MQSKTVAIRLRTFEMPFRFLFMPLLALTTLAVLSQPSPPLHAAAKDAVPEGFAPIRVKQRIEPRYPNWAYTHGIGRGYAKIAFYVHADGSVTDYFFVEYSHRAFAEELLATVEKWTIEPAHLHGQPIKSVGQAHWTFRPDRPIETNALFDTAKRIDRSDAASHRELAFAEEADLDAPVRMLRFAQVAVPSGYTLADPASGGVTVKCNFYLDASGQVALPQIVASTDPQLDEAILRALALSLFEPPRYQDRPCVTWMEKTYLIPLPAAP